MTKTTISNVVEICNQKGNEIIEAYEVKKLTDELVIKTTQGQNFIIKIFEKSTMANNKIVYNYKIQPSITWEEMPTTEDYFNINRDFNSNDEALKNAINYIFNAHKKAQGEVTYQSLSPIDSTDFETRKDVYC